MLFVDLCSVIQAHNHGLRGARSSAAPASRNQQQQATFALAAGFLTKSFSPPQTQPEDCYQSGWTKENKAMYLRDLCSLQAGLEFGVTHAHPLLLQQGLTSLVWQVECSLLSRFSCTSTCDATSFAQIY